MPTLNPNQYALALHTTTPQLGIAISNYNGDSRDRVWHLERDLAAHLHQHLQEILQPQTWQDIEFIAVAKGPGGFTGTRVGVVTARTIAQQLDIPLFGISTLQAIAFERSRESPNNYNFLAVQMRARQEQLFVAIYQPRGQKLQTYLADTLIEKAAWEQKLASLNSSYHLITADENIASTVTSILDLAYQQWQQDRHSPWSQVVPYYGQHPV